MIGKHLRTALQCTTALVIATGMNVAYAADTTGFEEIVVTAQKRAQNLQDVPIQVSAFTAQKIEDAGISTTQDFVNLVPNMSLDDSFTYLNTFVVVRGVTQINNADSPVAIVVDGVPQNNQKQFKQNLFDIERIEVLKGPQGALYGRNAIGGAVNIVTKQPTNEFEGFAAMNYGRGDAWEVSGGVSGPLTEDKVLFRVAGFYKQDDGRIDNTYLDKKADFVDHDYGFRGKLIVNPSDKVSVDLRASYNDFQAGGLYDSMILNGGANTYVKPFSNILGLTWGDVTEFTMKVDADLGVGTLTSISGYTDLTENYRGDLDFSNLVDKPSGFNGLGFGLGQGQDLGVKLYSQELRLVSPDDQRLRWIVGAFYIHTSRDLRTRGFVDIDGTREQIDTGLVIIDNNESNSNDAFALFAQFDYDVADKLVLSGALRYDYDNREQTDLTTSLVREKSFDSIQPKVTLTYNATDDALVYGTVSTGFRSGGYNAPVAEVPVFDDEFLTNYEVGFKSNWLNNRLIFNGAVYYSQVKDFQYFYVQVSTGAQNIDNIDKVDIWGVELEVQAMPVDGLEVFGSIGTTDTEIKEFVRYPQFEGNHTPKNTTWSLNAGFQYRAELTDGLSGLVRLDYEHRGKKYWQVDNADVQKPVDLFNVRAGVEGDYWSVALWGKNITGEKYYTDYNPPFFSGLDYPIGFLSQPATYGVEGRVKF